MIFYLVILIIIIFYLYYLKCRNFHLRYMGLCSKQHTSSANYVNIILNKGGHLLQGSQQPIGVLSSCLYGDDSTLIFKKKYIIPLINCINKARKTLPLWIYRIYLNPNISNHTVNLIKNTGCEICIMKYNSNNHNGSLWRYLPACENLPFISLDADDTLESSRLLERRWTLYLNEWLQGDKVFFHKRTGIINMFIPITGKYWGGKAHCIPNIQELINQHGDTWFGTDEAFLTRYVWPLFKDKGCYYTPLNLYEFMTIVIILIIILIIVNKIYTISTCK